MRGFTLIEVLIALAIVAFGLTALFTTVNQTARASDYLREKTFGGWIALNRITETRMSGKPPSDKETSGTVEFAGETWRWELKTIETAVDGIVRLEARAARESAREDEWPGFATGFMGDAVMPSQTNSPFSQRPPNLPSQGDAPGPSPQEDEQSSQ